MPSLAAQILHLHAQKKSRDEIQRETKCTSHYLRSVLSRASAPDEETRTRRTRSCPKGTPQYEAKIQGWCAYRDIIRMSGSKVQARAASAERRRAYLRSAASKTVQRVESKEANHA